MSRQPSRFIVLWLLAAVLLLAGLALSGLSYRALRDHEAGSRRLGLEIARLRELQARADRCDAARAAFEALPAAQSPAPLCVVREQLPQCRADALKEDRTEQMPGWTLHRQSLTVGDVSMSQLLPVIAAIEAQRPPWLMTRFAVTGSPRGPGFGCVELGWEALERGDAKPAPGR